MTEPDLHSRRLRTALVLLVASVPVLVAALVLRDGWLVMGGGLIALAGREARRLATSSASFAASSALRRPEHRTPSLMELNLAPAAPAAPAAPVMRSSAPRGASRYVIASVLTVIALGAILGALLGFAKLWRM